MIDLKAGYAGKTVAVTGAGGYIGSAIVDLLVESGARVIRVSRTKLEPLKNTDVLVGEVSAAACWEVIIAQSDIIIHLAGNTSVYFAKEEPVDSAASAILPVAHLIRTAKRFGKIPRVVFASTATVYGVHPRLPVGEDAPVDLVTLYDLHKWCAERQLQFATEQGLIEGVSLRLANVYGPSDSVSSACDRGVLNRVARLAFEGKVITIFGGGEYLRDYVYISDVARAFAYAGAGNRLAGHSFNIGSGKGIYFKDAFIKIAKRAEQISGKSVVIEYKEWPNAADPIEHRNYFADIAHFSSHTGWRPLITFDEGVDMMFRRMQ